MVERCATSHHYYPIGVYTPLALTVTIDPSIPRSFLQQIIDHIVVNDGRVISITFKNGSTHTFTYKA